MSLNDLQAHKLIGGATIGGGGGWQRPSDWLEMPTVLETEEKFVGLFAVYDLPENFIALYFEGDYTVDWGDGTVQDFNSEVIAQHSYSWSDIPSSTLTTKGYRQVLVTVTPQSGQNLTIMDLSVRHDNINTNGDTNTPWLDLAVSMPNADSGGSLRFCGYEYGLNSNGYLLDVQRINIIHAGGMTDFTECFYYFTSLGSVTIQNCPSADSFNYLFDYCVSLKSVSLPDTSSVTNMSYMFSDCYALTSVSLPDTSSVMYMSSMFYNCYALTSVSLPDTSSVMYMNNMFNSCHALTTVSLPDTSSVTNMSNMFYYCSSLTSVSLPDTSSVTDMNNMFNSCYALTTVSLPDTSSVTNMSGMFYNCYALTTVSLPDTSSVTDMSSMFYYCSSLTSVSLPDTSSVTDMSYMFSDCYALQEATMPGTATDISYNNCLLGRQAIVDIFNGLGTVSGNTINISNNYGVADLISTDYDIATGKGWTIVA